VTCETEEPADNLNAKCRLGVDSQLICADLWTQNRH